MRAEGKILGVDPAMLRGFDSVKASVKATFSLLDATRRFYSCPSRLFFSPAIPSALECAVY